MNIRQYLLGILLIVLLGGCKSKELEIEESANSIVLVAADVSLTSTGKSYKYRYKDSRSHKINQDYILIKNKIDAIVYANPTNTTFDIPEYDPYLPDSLIGLFDITEWQTPKIHVIAKKFRSVDYGNYIDITIENK